MSRFGTHCIAFGLQFVFAAATIHAQSTAPPPAPTFTKDVAPILQKNCQTCHRPGEGGPFPLITYDQVRPMAPSIKRVVSQKIMPPWFADPKYGHFSNNRSLSQKDIATLVTWVNGGAQEGDPKDMPPPAEFLDGWGIPKPDVDFPAREAFQHSRERHDRLSVHDRSHGIHGRQMGANGRSSSRPIARWSITSSPTCANRAPAISRATKPANFSPRHQRRKTRKPTPARCPAIS